MLYYNTVNDILKKSLHTIMKAPVFNNFRLVGGTALSLQIGHRESVDIDLFTDSEYGSVDFRLIDSYLKENFKYVDFLDIPPALGRSYFIGDSKDDSIKLDVFYTDSFIQSPIEVDGVRMATIEEIIAMKVDVIQRSGRKKDFWDLHEFIEKYNINEMLALHQKRYPYTHNANIIKQNFKNFEIADDDFDPICLKGKYWVFIKEDFEDFLK